jgi:predicted metal-dependent hydrolase
MNYYVKFGSSQIDFSLEYSERKSLGIKVHPDGKVDVLAPFNVKEAEIMEKIQKKAPWILRQIDHFRAYVPVTPPRRFVGGETHLFLGRQYRLKVVPDSLDIIKAYRGQLWMYSRSTKPEVLKKQLNEWYRCKAFIVFRELLEELLPKFRRYQIAAPVLMIRRMSKRWGSCTPSGRLILNTALIKAPKGCIEYVITHELCHVVYHHHGKPFQDLLEKMMPNWRKWKERLERSLI